MRLVIILICANILISMFSAVIFLVSWLRSLCSTSDCIGSAFNAKGRMQCPNCRHVEQGQWLYASGCFLPEDFVEDLTIDEDATYIGATNLVGLKLK